MQGDIEDILKETMNEQAFYKNTENDDDSF